MTQIEKEILAIENMIYIIRGQKVMLDSDLAKLYEVETKNLNKSVSRNLKRFPVDFMFQLTEIEEESLRFQIGTSKREKGGRRYLPYVFTENGVAMLSSVLTSERAVEVNIAIMRTFTKLRSFLLMESAILNRMDKLEVDSTQLFKIVFERLDKVEDIVNPTFLPNRSKIGLKN